MTRHEQYILLSAMVCLAALAWAYILHLGLQYDAMATAMVMPAVIRWSMADFAFMFLMWAVMMFAMMLPSVMPTVMIYGQVQRKRAAAGRLFTSTAAFVSGYLVVWIGFSLIATVANWQLHANGALSGMMGNVTPATGGILLISAGIFQWTPLKDACLDHCRSPISFLMQHWRERSLGATLMGLHHGAYCLGCCWLLMALLFGLGVMNLLWVALLTLVVLAEKLLPQGRTLSRALGILFVIWGIWLVAGW